MKVAVIGAGAYGLALATILIKNNHDVIMWSENEKNIKQISKTHHFDALGDTLIPKGIKFTTSYSEALINRDLIIIASAAKFVDNVARDIQPFITDKMHFCICSKGIEVDTCKFVHEVFKSHIKTKKLAIVSGPSFAIDIANGEPVGLSVASKNKKTVELVKSAFCCNTVKIRESKSKDIIGLEICGSIKNVIAIASGIIAGLGYSESTQAFLITESLHDIKSLIDKLGGNKKTILSFAGVGDLLLTCTSTKSRNFSYGYLVGSYSEEAEKYLKETTVEGYYTLKSIHKLIKKKKVSMPIINLIYRIIVNKQDPTLLIDFLINKK